MINNPLPGLLFLIAGSVWPVFSSAQVFTESALSMGIDHVYKARDLTGGGVAFFDYDNDGDEDLYLNRGSSRDYLYKNNGNGTFSLINADIGIFSTVQYNTTGVTTGDIDNDGDRDIFVTTWEMYNGPTAPLGRNLLFLNDGDGTFTEIGIQAGLTETTFSEGALFFDYDKDGFLDIYVMNHIENVAFTYDSNGVINGYAHDCFPNFLYHNNGDLTFTEVSQQLNVTGTNGCTIAGVASDYDMDGDLDLYLANDFGYWLEPNVLYENTDGMGNFVDVSAATGADVQAFGMGIAAGDYDRDLDMDYYTTSIGRNILIENQGGTFEDVSVFAGVENPTVPGEGNTTGWGTAFLDVDNDGWLDLYVSNGRMSAIAAWATAVQDPDKLFLNNGDKTFSDVSEQAGVADTDYNRGMAYSDFDQDGDLDIFVVTLDELDFHSKFYINETINDNHYIQFKLVGTESNRDAYGAKIWLYVGGETFLREIYGGGDTYSSQNSSIVHYGLGAMTAIDSVRIDWPNGRVEVHNGFEVDMRHTITESEGDPPLSSGGWQHLNGVDVFPNPFTDNLQIRFGRPPSSRTHLELLNAMGRTVAARSLEKGAVETGLSLDGPIGSGVYLLRITSGNAVRTEKVVRF